MTYFLNQSYVLAPFQTKLSSHFRPLSHVRVDVVIPTLDEEEYLPRCLGALKKDNWPHNRIIVSDGGSQDSTRNIAQEHGISTINEATGRAKQMNAGAACGTGEVILFLHADTLIQRGTYEAIKNAVSNGAAGGCFARTFVPNNPLLQITSWLAAFRAWGLGIAYGDQGIWIRRDLFEKIGGFPIQDVFEDVELSLQIMEHGPLDVLRPVIRTSSRRLLKKKGQLRKDAELTWRYYLSRLNR